MSAKKEIADSSEISGQVQYLLFLAGGKLFAVEALKAKEIVEYVSVTKVPMMNPYVKGVTNIRGNIVPVIDILERFGTGSITIGDKTSIVVVNYEYEGSDTQIGIMIDEVYEVDSIENADLRKAPEFGSKVNSRFILSMGKYNKEYIAILNTDTILNVDELSRLSQ